MRKVEKKLHCEEDANEFTRRECFFTEKFQQVQVEFFLGTDFPHLPH